MRNGIFVMGPAGCGKSTYCLEIYKNFLKKKGGVKIINMDPSIENIEYPESIDIRDLIKIEDVMDEFNLGPNGGLIFCMEYFMDNLTWFQEEIEYSENKNIIFDFPGQIEIYTHCNLVRDFVEYIKKTLEINLFGNFLLDCQFVGDLGKFFGGAITALCCMFSIEIIHFNILSKVDLINHIPYVILEKFLYPCGETFTEELNQIINQKYKILTKSLVKLISDFSMTQFIPLDLTNHRQLTNLMEFFKFFNE